MAIYKYKRVTTEPGPNGATLYFRCEGCTELAEVDGWRYVFVPDSATVPEQFAQIEAQTVQLSDDLREQIKNRSRPVELISMQMQEQIHARYPVEDEMYFARIGIGAALGIYQFQPGEMEALRAFGAFVETVRQWGRDQRAAIGL